MILVFGLFTVGFNSSQASIEETAANDLLTATLANLRATPRTSSPRAATTTATLGIPIPASPVASSPSATILYFDNDGTFTTTLAPTSRYRLEITFLPTPRANAATQTLLKVTWPAPAPPAKATGSVSMFVTFDRN